MPKSYGQCMSGGPLTVPGIPIPVDPTIHYVRPEPAKPEPKRPEPVKPRTYTRAPGARKQGERIPDEMRASILREWAEGASAVSIAARHGVHRVTVNTICRGAA